MKKELHYDNKLRLDVKNITIVIFFILLSLFFLSNNAFAQTCILQDEVNQSADGVWFLAEENAVLTGADIDTWTNAHDNTNGGIKANQFQGNSGSPQPNPLPTPSFTGSGINGKASLVFDGSNSEVLKVANVGYLNKNNLGSCGI